MHWGRLPKATGLIYICVMGFEKPPILCSGCGEWKTHKSRGLCAECHAVQSGKRAMKTASHTKVTRDVQTGRPECRWCKQPVPKGKRTFCGDDCIHEWRMRTSPQYVRMVVFERDQGVCAKCSLSTPAMELKLSDIFVEDAAQYNKAWNALLDKGFSRNRRHGLWDADHIQSIRDGGGLCGLDNYRTLCIPCHKEETKKLHKRMAIEKKAGRDPNAIPHGTAWTQEEIEVATLRAKYIQMLLNMDVAMPVAQSSY
jgi:5-methylcytosine-specific restriction protein A